MTHEQRAAGSGQQAGEPVTGGAAYDRVKTQAAKASRERSEAGRDIGPPTPVVDPARKAAAEVSLRQFCESYLPLSFYLGWSAAHLRAIARLEDSILRGGQFCLAMPRGSGKTTLLLAATLWALLYGHRRFVVLIASDKARARGLLEDLKTELEANDELAADFPEVVYAIRALERIANRCKGQTSEGVATNIQWTKDAICLPAINGSPAASSLVKVAGLTGGIRGMRFTRPDGVPVRPDLCLIDDPQTDESAASATQCEQRERIISGGVLGLAGPGQKIAALMSVTVIRRGDLADRHLDRMLHPEWQGERTKLLTTLPTNDKLWDEYAQLRREGLRDGEGTQRATEFYAANRVAMDAGGVASWPERHEPDQLSGIQYGMDLKLADEHAFWAEYQNEPLADDGAPSGMLTADQIAAKTNGLARGRVMTETEHLVAFIDVQQKCLFYAVCGFGSNFTGQVIDYGVYPDAGLRYFTLSKITKTLAKAAPGAGFEGALYEGLTKLAKMLLTAEYTREDGAKLTIATCLVDANWGKSTETVKKFVRQSGYGERLWPAHGRSYGPTQRALNDAKKQPGERRGECWQIPRLLRGGVARHVLYDVNHWKSFLHARLATVQGDRGALTLFGKRASDHRLLAEHLTAETPTEVTAKNRTVEMWELAKPGLDNHWLDCVVGCLVGGAINGCELIAGATKKTGRAGRKVSLAELQRQKRAQRG